MTFSSRTVLNGGERKQEMMQDKKKIKDPPQNQPKWWRSAAVSLFVITFPFPLAFIAPLLPSLRAASVSFWGAMVKKGVS